MSKPANTPFVLIIRDGWGENPHPSHDSFNAIKLARKPVDDMLRREWPGTLVKTSGEDVGVPEGQTGNSEVGHQNIGAGRIVDQEVVRISKACRTGEIAEVAAIKETIVAARDSGRAVHLMGIASEAGVHGRLSHLYALLEACKKHGMAGDRVFVHLFTDGRDTGPFTGKGFVEEAEQAIRRIGIGAIATLAGRYWAMDRDYRWERVQTAYLALTGRGNATKADALGGTLETIPHFTSASEAMQSYYDHPTAPTLGGDEFVTPCIIGKDRWAALACRIAENDSVIFYNYRGDRPREIAAAFVYPDADWAKVKPSPDSGKNGFERGPRLNTHFVCMTAYSEDLAKRTRVAFDKPPKMPKIAGEVWSALGLRQFRCAETEKFPHVTFFFNDYRDEPFPGESRENPQSPRVATYDLKPEMAADQVRDAVLKRLAAGDCEEIIIVNFANCDMVGHTGVLRAAIKAVEFTDACVGAIIDATLKKGGSLIVTADHGNAEQMFDPETNAPHTAHTEYDVPLYVVGAAFKGRKLRGDMNAAGWFKPEVRASRGRLADVVPTAMAMMSLGQPGEMTGKTLLA